MFDLHRFTNAQADAKFEEAIEELRTGPKRDHWIWFIFPQLTGLGSSSESRFYGVQGVAEALAYLREPELRERLLAVSEVVAQQLEPPRSKALIELMGSKVGVQKLVSSMTLFGQVARQLLATEGLAEYGRLVKTASEILSAAAIQGFPACAYTLDVLATSTVPADTDRHQLSGPPQDP